MLETVLYPDELKHRDASYQCEYSRIHPKGREQDVISFPSVNNSSSNMQSVTMALKKKCLSFHFATCKITAKFVQIWAFMRG